MGAGCSGRNCGGGGFSGGSISNCRGSSCNVGSNTGYSTGCSGRSCPFTAGSSGGIVEGLVEGQGVTLWPVSCRVDIVEGLVEGQGVTLWPVSCRQGRKTRDQARWQSHSLTVSQSLSLAGGCFGWKWNKTVLLICLLNTYIFLRFLFQSW